MNQGSNFFAGSFSIRVLAITIFDFIFQLKLHGLNHTLRNQYLDIMLAFYGELYVLENHSFNQVESVVTNAKLYPILFFYRTFYLCQTYDSKIRCSCNYSYLSLLLFKYYCVEVQFTALRSCSLVFVQLKMAEGKKISMRFLFLKNELHAGKC